MLVQMTCYSSLFFQINDGYAKSLEILSKKLRFSQVDPMINASNSLKDIKPELERLLQKALCKVTSGTHSWVALLCPELIEICLHSS